jgi:beta-xylosidase
MTRFITPLLLLTILGACAAETEDATTPPADEINAAQPAPPAPVVEAESSSYTNPVLAADCPDPGVLKGEEGAFYMVCTGGSFRIRKSSDLVTWTDSGTSIFPAGKPPWAMDGKRDWAPEIHQLGPDNFVATYTASDGSGKLAVGAAYATTPEGPFTDVGQPLVQDAIGVIDSTIFADDDGRKYLFWKVDGNQRQGGRTPIMGRELSADGHSFKPDSVAKEVFNNLASSWEGPLVEAPFIVKREGFYYMFYSGNVYDDRYKTGVARATSPLETFTRKGDPILKNNAKWVGPGHGTVVAHEGTDWFVHHAWPTDAAGNIARERGRQVVLARIGWKDGWPSIEGDSTPIGPQAAP